MTGPQRADQAKVIVMAVVNVGALAQSYRGLLDFASHTVHWPLWTAWTFPLFIDSFVVVGELQLYTAHARGTSKWSGAALAAAGLAGSVLGNIAHVGADATLLVKLAAAVPPLAAAASLGVVLGLVKRRARSPRRDGEASPAAPRRSAPARRINTRSQFWASTPQARALAERIRAGEDLSQREVATILSEQLERKVTRYAAGVLITAAKGTNGKGERAPEGLASE